MHCVFQLISVCINFCNTRRGCFCVYALLLCFFLILFSLFSHQYFLLFIISLYFLCSLLMSAPIEFYVYVYLISVVYFLQLCQYSVPEYLLFGVVIVVISYARNVIETDCTWLVTFVTWIMLCIFEIFFYLYVFISI